MIDFIQGSNLVVFLLPGRCYCNGSSFKGGVIPGDVNNDLAWACLTERLGSLNTERSYKRQGHAPLKHFVGFLCNHGKPE